MFRGAHLQDRALCAWVTKTRYNAGRDNKSLDASGISGLVIDNVSVTWLTAAASTLPFGGFAH